MPDNTGKVVVSLLLMVGLWIGVYWWWPVEPPISFAGHRSQLAPQINDNASTPRKAEPVTVLRQGEPVAGDEQPARARSREERIPPGRVIGVIAPEFIEHSVGAGETFESISRMYFGTSDHAGAISAANGLMSPGALRAGRVVRVPRDPRNVQGVAVVSGGGGESGAKSMISAPGEYLVQKGDVLGRISQKVYGTTKHATLIFEANRDKLRSPDSVREGQMLIIPPLPDIKKENR